MPFNTEVKDKPSSVMQLASAMATLGLYHGANTPAEHAAVRSNWVKKEVETAFEREDRSHRLVLFPVRLDDAVFEIESGWAADVRRMRNIGDMRQWKDHDAYQKVLKRVLRDLRAEEAAPDPDRLSQ